MRAGTELSQLLALIDQAYNRKSWHGTNLRGSLRSVSPAAATWRPGPARHNIWELAVHAAYWKYTVWRRLTGAERGTFALKGSNWFTRPDADSSAAAWQKDVALLDRTHRELRGAIEAFSPRALHRTPKGSKFDYAALISGVAAHDLYHAGQIQLLKRLLPGALT
jgi:hypothetical protein